MADQVDTVSQTHSLAHRHFWNSQRRLVGLDLRLAVARSVARHSAAHFDDFIFVGLRTSRHQPSGQHSPDLHASEIEKNENHNTLFLW